METKRLLETLEALEVIGHVPNQVTGLAYHSQSVKPGDIFVAIKGYVTDGHRYIKNAVDQGASLIICEKMSQTPVPQIRVANSRLALALLANAFYQSPSKKLFTVGITATNGKTSTSFMVDHLFKAAGKTTGIIGTVMTKYAEVLVPSVLTTPESLDLHQYFADMVNHKVSHATMEVSSSGQELDRVGGVDFDVVTLNNISHEHIDQHGSFKNYLYHKTKLIKNAKADSWAILNLDDEYSKALIGQTKARVLTYGVEDRSGDLVVHDLDLSTARAKMTLELTRPLDTQFGRVESTRFGVQLSVAGYHSVMNALAAIGVGLVSGLSIGDIQTGIKAYQGVERRFEIIHEKDITIIDDHFANMGNIDVTLTTMDYMQYKNLVFVYAIRGSRGRTVNRENAQTIAKWAPKLGLKRVIATLSQGHVSTKDVVTPEELAVFMEEMQKAGLEVDLYDDLTQAINWGLDQAQTGDVVLLAGCQGMDFGGHIALKSMAVRHPEYDKEDLFKPIKDRVCGIEKEVNHE